MIPNPDSPPKPQNSKLPAFNPSIQKALPDDNSQKYESTTQGLPPVQVGSSENHLHEGHLGEVTLRGGQ